MIMQLDCVTHLQLACFDPFIGLCPTGLLTNTAHPMIFSQTDLAACRRADTQNWVDASREKACADSGICLTIDQGGKWLADQFMNLIGSVGGHDPGIRRDTRVCGLKSFTVIKVIIGIGPVHEQHPRLCMVVGGSCDLVPNLLSPNGTVYPKPVFASIGPLVFAFLAGFGGMHQFPCRVGFDRPHQPVGHAHADIEIG